MCPGVGLLDHMATLFLVSEEPRHFFPWWLHQLTFPPSSVGEFPFSTLRGIYLIPEYEHVYSNLRRKKKNPILPSREEFYLLFQGDGRKCDQKTAWFG